MKYYIVVGERSGDMHGANLMREIRKLDQEAEFRFMGGEAMQAVGGTMVQHYGTIAIMGFIEVLKKLIQIRNVLKKIKADILNYKPDVVILIDSSGFNMRIAKFCKKNHVLNYYYIAPKVWAWNNKRAYTIKANVDRLFGIFPFEVAFFKKYGYDMDYVGNPLLDQIHAFQADPDFLTKHHLDPNKSIIALLPGSRKQEVKKMLPRMVEVQKQFPNHQFIIAGVNNLDKSLYEPYLKDVKIIYEKAYDLLSVSEAALVTSGTATLETALLGVPQVVCYFAGYIYYHVMKNWVLTVSYLSLVNLIAEKGIVKEMIQKDCDAEHIGLELKKILKNEPERAVMEREYQILKEKIGGTGASQKTAELMVAYLKKDKGIL